jgi:hypothetical protein
VTPSSPEITARIEVGGFHLEIGAPAGTSASPAPGAVVAAEEDLAPALDQVDPPPDEEDPSAATALSDVVDRAEDVTSHVERATDLFQKLATDRTLDPMDFRPEIDRLLDRLAELDRSGRLPEALKLARALERLLALIKRWQALGRTLATAMRAARGLRDQEAIAWARHELGTFKLAGGDVAAADRHLTAARDLREELGDRAGLRVTQGNLQSLCHKLRQELHEGRPPPTDGWSFTRIALPLAAAAALLLAGGVAGAVIGGGGDGGAELAAETDEVDTGGTATTGPVTQHGLSVEPGPNGSIRTRGGDQIVCPPGPCSARFDDGALVVLTATANDGFEFKGWGLDCKPSQGFTCELTLSRDRRVTATFGEPEPVEATLTVTLTSANISVASSPEGISCPDACTLTRPVGTKVTLTADRTGEASSEALFQWGGECSDTPGTDSTCDVVLGGETSASVGYQPPVESPTDTTDTTGPILR